MPILADRSSSRTWVKVNSKLLEERLARVTPSRMSFWPVLRSAMTTPSLLSLIERFSRLP